jgi:hypothetical protein
MYIGCADRPLAKRCKPLKAHSIGDLTGGVPLKPDQGGELAAYVVESCSRNRRPGVADLGCERVDAAHSTGQDVSGKGAAPAATRRWCQKAERER